MIGIVLLATAMRSVTHENLGILIAYVIPGFTALWGIRCFSPVVASWLDTSASSSSTVGAFLFVSLASLGLGVLANLVRGLTIDPLQRRVGVLKGDWKYSLLQTNIAAVEFLVVNQFRYYQFAGNLLVIVPFTAACQAICSQQWRLSVVAACAFAELVLWFGARDCLRTYYRRLDEVLASSANTPDKSTSVEEPPADDPCSTDEDGTVGSGEN